MASIEEKEEKEKKQDEEADLAVTRCKLLLYTECCHELPYLHPTYLPVGPF